MLLIGDDGDSDGDDHDDNNGAASAAGDGGGGGGEDGDNCCTGTTVTVTMSDAETKYSLNVKSMSPHFEVRLWTRFVWELPDGVVEGLLEAARSKCPVPWGYYISFLKSLALRLNQETIKQLGNSRWQLLFLFLQ